MAGQIKGFPEVMTNLNREIRGIKKRSMAGLINAAAIIRYDMDKTEPLIPVDTGNLRSSWFVTTFYSGTSPGVVIGFSANYAPFVHEMVDKGTVINWNRPGSGPRFFVASINRNHQNVLNAIKNEAMIK